MTSEESPVLHSKRKRLTSPVKYRIYSIKKNPWGCRRHLQASLLLEDESTLKVNVGRTIWITEPVYSLNKEKIADDQDVEKWNQMTEFYVTDKAFESEEEMTPEEPGDVNSENNPDSDSQKTLKEDTDNDAVVDQEEPVETETVETPEEAVETPEEPGETEAVETPEETVETPKKKSIVKKK